MEDNEKAIIYLSAYLHSKLSGKSPPKKLTFSQARSILNTIINNSGNQCVMDLITLLLNPPRKEIPHNLELIPIDEDSSFDEEIEIPDIEKIPELLIEIAFKQLTGNIPRVPVLDERLVYMIVELVGEYGKSNYMSKISMGIISLDPRLFISFVEPFIKKPLEKQPKTLKKVFEDLSIDVTFVDIIKSSSMFSIIPLAIIASVETKQCFNFKLDRSLNQGQEQFEFLVVMPPMSPRVDMVLEHLRIINNYLDEGGLELLLLPYSFLKGNKAKELITFFEGNNITLDSVIFLPKSPFRGTHIRTTLLVLEKEKHTIESPRRVLMASLTGLSEKERIWIARKFIKFKKNSMSEESAKHWSVPYELVKNAVYADRGIPSWNPLILIDRPVSSSGADLFGYEERVGYIEKTLLQVRPPVIGIVGEWGSGKTSIMSMLMESLKDKSEELDMDLAIMWINLWEFTQIGFSAQEIVYSVLDKIKNIVSDESLKKKINTVLKNSVIFTSVLRGVGLGNIADAIEQIRDAFSEMNNLLKVLDDISRDLQKNNKYFIIFLDDLDRLTPEEAKKAIDVIRVLSSRRNITVVVGYDHDALLSLLSVSMPYLDTEKFLEKIIPIKYNVPKLSLDEYMAVIFDLLESSGFVSSMVARMKLTKELALVSEVLQFNLRRLKIMMTYIFQTIDTLMDKIETEDKRITRIFERNKTELLRSIIYLSALQASHPDLFFKLTSERKVSHLDEELIELFESAQSVDNSLKKLLFSISAINKKTLEIVINLMTASQKSTPFD